MWRRIANLMVKEFLTLMRDPKSRVVLIVPPLIQIFIFGYAATLDLNHVPFAVYNQDRGAAARDLVDRFRGSPHFQEITRVASPRSERELIDNQTVLFVLHLAPDFTRRLLRGEPAAAQVIIDGRNSNTALIAQSYARDVVNEFSRAWTASHGLRGPPATLVTRAWFNPNLLSRWFIVPGIVGLLLQVVALTVTALSVAREREQGTFDQLLVTPMRPVEILIGKALPGFLVGLLEATAIVLIAVFWFDVPLRGSLYTLYAGFAVFLLAAVGTGLMISSFAVTMQQGLLGAFLYMVPAVILSGFATPIANMPRVVQALTLLNPMRYFMVIVRGVFLEGASFAVLLGQFWPLLAIGLATLTLAGWLFRRRLY